MGSPFHLQGIFPTKASNLGLPHCRQILLPAEPQGKPKNTGVGSLCLLQGIFPTQESNWGLLHCRQILYQLSYEGSLGFGKCALFTVLTFSETNWRLNQFYTIFIVFFFNFILFLNFTILYWFCPISKWIRHRYTCVPHPEPSSLPIPSLWVVPFHRFFFLYKSAI